MVDQRMWSQSAVWFVLFKVGRPQMISLSAHGAVTKVRGPASKIFDKTQPSKSWNRKMTAAQFPDSRLVSHYLFLQPQRLREATAELWKVIRPRHRINKRHVFRRAAADSAAPTPTRFLSKGQKLTIATRQKSGHSVWKHSKYKHSSQFNHSVGLVSKNVCFLCNLMLLSLFRISCDTFCGIYFSTNDVFVFTFASRYLQENCLLMSFGVINKSSFILICEKDHISKPWGRNQCSHKALL